MPGAQASARLRAAVVGAAALVLLAGLGNIDLWAPDEPRYVQVADELRAMPRGAIDWVVLRLDGEVYTQKPPLYFWLAAALGTPPGRVTEVAGRLPSALAGLALVAATLALGTRLFGGRVGVLGAALLLTTYEFARNARRAQLDVLLALLETAALVCFWRLDRGIGPRRLQIAGLHAALGLAVLTKGPVGFLVPILVMAGYLAWERRLGSLPRLLPPWSLLLSLGPGLVWIAAAIALTPSGFAAEAVGENLFGRFFAGTSHARSFHYFFKTYPLDCLPWTLLWPMVLLAAPQALGRGVPAGALDEGRRRAWRLLLAWVGASFVFFSISSGKRGLYLLPTYPAAVLLCADAVVRTLAGRARMPRAVGFTAAILALLVVAAGVELGLAASTGRSAILASASFPELRAWSAARLARIDGGLATAFACGTIGVVSLACAAWLVLERQRAAPLLRAAVVVGAVFGIQLAVFLLGFPALNAERSPRPIALAAARATEPGERVGLVGQRALAGGIAYYGERRTAHLKTPESIAAFVAEGGRVFVVRPRHVARIESAGPVRVLARARSGRREVWVVERTDAPGTDGAVRRRTAP